MSGRILGLAVTVLATLAVCGCAVPSATPGYQLVYPTATLGAPMAADPVRGGPGGTINPATGISESGGE